MQKKENSIFQQLRLVHWLLLFYPILIQVIARQRVAGESLELDRSAKLQIVLVGFYGIYAFTKFFCGSKEKARQYFRSPLIWMSVYVLTMLASAFWSVNPKLTLFRSLQLIIFYLLGVESLRTLPDIGYRVKYFILFALSLVISGSLQLISDQSFFSKSGFSYLACFGFSDILAIAVILSFLIRSKLWRRVTLVLLVFILLSMSAKVYIGFACALATYILLTDSSRRKWLQYILLIAIVFGVFFPMVIKLIFFQERTDKDIFTGHGRTVVWEAILADYVKQRPFLGYGYSASQQSMYADSSYNFQVLNSHNIYIGTLLGTGIIGLTSLLILFVSAFRAALKMSQANQRAVFTAALVAMIVIGIATSLFSARVTCGGVGHLLLLCLVLLTSQESYTSSKGRSCSSAHLYNSQPLRSQKQ